MPTSRLDRWFVHTVQVKPKLGGSTYGDKHGGPFPMPCWFEDVTELVRDADGNEVVSSARLAADLSNGPKCPVGSLVETPHGREARVLKTSWADSGGLGNLDHLELFLT